jgi:hypothetical protein
MENDESREWYLAQSDANKQLFLMLVSYELTIHGRGFGVDLKGTAQVNALLGLNELQHQLSSHIFGIATQQSRYPDDVLWNILHEKAAYYGILANLKHSVKYASGRTPSNKPN